MERDLKIDATQTSTPPVSEERAAAVSAARARMRAELQPLLDELGLLGVPPDRLYWGFAQRDPPPEAVVPTLLKWLERLDGREALNVIGRSLAYRSVLRNSETVQRLASIYRGRACARDAVGIVFETAASRSHSSVVRELIAWDVSRDSRGVPTARLVSALGRMRGDPEAAAFAASLADTEAAELPTSLRFVAITEALAKLNPAASVPYLIELTEHDPSPDARSAAKAQLRAVRRRRWPATDGDPRIDD